MLAIGSLFGYDFRVNFNTGVGVLLIIYDMNVHLVEGNLDSFLVKARLDRFENIKLYSPVIGTFCPYASGDVDRGCGVLAHSDKGCGILQYEGVRLANFGDDLLCLAEVC